MTRKVHKTLNKRCPECSGRLEIIEYSREIDDVIFYENYIECQDCDYTEELSNKHKRERDEYGRRL